MLKISLYTHFAALLSLLIVALIFVLIVVFLKFDQAAVKIFGILFLVDAIPALFLHFEYWERNREQEYEIHDDKIIIRTNEGETCFKNYEIDKIIVYVSPALYKNSNFHLIAIESYHYAVVRLKTGETITLTSLLAPRIDKLLELIKDVTLEKKKRLFCKI